MRNIFVIILSFLSFCYAETVFDDFGYQSSTYMSKTEEIVSENENIAVTTKIVPVKNSPCMKQLDFFFSSLKNREWWALRFFDMSAKPVSGLLHGHKRHLGLFDKCLEFRHFTPSAGVIDGQYCQVHFKPTKNANETKDNNKFGLNDLAYMLHSANTEADTDICAPAKCSTHELKDIANSYLDEYNLKVDWVYCQQKYKVVLNPYDYLVIFFFLMLALTIAASTYYDMSMKSENTSKSNLLTAFSLYTNTTELLTIDHSPSKSTITCLFGLRVIAALWVISFHRVQKFIMSRPLEWIDFYKQFVNGLNRYGVDVFFLISTILIARSMIAAFEKNNMNLMRIYINRYMRYAPCVAVLVLIFTSFIPRAMVDGPFAGGVDWNVNSCQKNWLPAMLMLQTITNVKEMCLSHTWYLSNDFQMYMLSPIFVYFLWKYEWNTVTVYAVYLILKGLLDAYLSYYNIIGNESFFKLHIRLSQWIAGLIIGYIIYHMEKSSYKLSKLYNIVLWICIVFLHKFIRFCVKNIWYKSAEGRIFEGYHDVLYTIMIGLIIISCHFYQSGNPVQWFLSHPLWQPLAKLTMSIYLTHDIYILMTSSNIKDTAHYDGGWMIHIFLGDVLASLLLGILLYLCVEAPCTKILVYFMKGEKKYGKVANM